MLDQTVREFGLTTPQYAALSVLARRDRLSSAQLARRAFVSPQAMNQIVAQLEETDLITREPDLANRRILRASLTHESRCRLVACEEAVDHIEDEMLKDLDADGVELLRQGLQCCAVGLRGFTESARAE